MGQALGCVQVDQSTVAIKENFGKYNGVLGPGCHFMPWCFGSRLSGYLPLRVQQLDIRCESKTKGLVQMAKVEGLDNVFVTLVASIQYRALADKAADAFYKLSNTKEQIQAYVFDVQTLIVDVEPDAQVKNSMNEINAASRLGEAAYEKTGEKILQIKQAEGKAESSYLAGLGIARQRQAIVEGLKASVIGFFTSVPGASTKDVMDMILITQYFDTMKEIGVSSNSSAVFIPHEPEDVISEHR
ncbi:hypothetical protein RND71_040729 [Anisodus tanguticus]|uniref:Band 7 domain-containing protein n=1 Tax=Anisodus tanguticus TaxID=243964 RepID=A0AAE1QW38_9SOLA|nr:hypothetical protein RND71_040729 [Anisodus tanguticus]